MSASEVTDRRSEERLGASLQSSPAVVFEQDKELRYTWIHNPKTPFAVDQVLGKTDFELLPHADAEAIARVKRSVMESGAGTRTVVRVTIAGQTYYYDLAVEPLRDGGGRVVGVRCASWDITEQQRSEQEQRLLAKVAAALMKAAGDYERTLTELAEVAVRELADWFLIDLVESGGVRRLEVKCSDPANEELAQRLRCLALDRAQPHLAFEPLTARRPILMDQVSEEDLRSMAQSAEHLGILERLQVRSFIAVPLLARDRLVGALALVSSRASHRYDERDLALARQLAHVAALAVDHAQVHRAAQQAIAVRDEVLGIVAHDLRNPLYNLLMQTDLLRRDDRQLGAAALKRVEAIERGLMRMSRLIQDMLDITSLDAGALAIEPVPLAPRELLEELLESQCEEVIRAGLVLSLEADEPLSKVLGDRGRLLQVFANLIGNAIKFTEPGGRIVVGAAPATGQVRFWVADTGRGIAPEHVAHLFDRFWQARRADGRGAGLGLTIVKGIIEGHGGRIWVDTQLGEGTTFHFTIPEARR